MHTVDASGQSGSFATWDDHTLTLDNGVVRRVVALGSAGVRSTELNVAGGAENLLCAANPGDEFRFTVEGRPFAGGNGWKRLECQHARDDQGGCGATVNLVSPDGLNLTVTYLVYPGLPVVRKFLVFENGSKRDLALENLDVESLLPAHDDVNSHVYTDYGRRMKIGPVVGDCQDALTILHTFDGRSRVGTAGHTRSLAPWGLAIGNEAPGVMKRTAFFEGPDARLSVGLTHADQPAPFRKWLAPGASWESPAVFLVPYAGTDDPRAVVNGPVNDFVRRHLGIRLAAIEKRPAFVYNTWVPFENQIDEALILELARQAAEMGFEEFVIDDGWQANRHPGDEPHPTGDWLVNREKFPRGLAPVFDEIKRLGMKPGLWISLGGVSRTSEIHARHPEWMVRDAKGRPTDLHFSDNPDRVTACLASGWKDHFKQILLRLVRDHGLEYVKLDFAVVTSAYVHDPAHAGCHATDHAGHRDHAESFYAAYDALWKLLDDMHEAAPTLFIDCTFEAMGKLQLIDYAMCRHAEGNWLSNFTEAAPFGSWRVRQMAWWRSPAMPANALVIGNQQLDDPDWELSMQSLTGAFPIFLGDLRKVKPAQIQRIRQWSDWLKAMERDFTFSLYRQDLPGFGEPAEGAWDGFARINTDTGQGGFVAVFRHFALESTRRVFLPGLPPDVTYAVRQAPDGVPLATLTGRELADIGIPVTLSRPAEGRVLEVRAQGAAPCGPRESPRTDSGR